MTVTGVLRSFHAVCGRRAPIAESADGEGPVPLRLLRAYIGQARTYEPDVPEHLTGGCVAGQGSVLRGCGFSRPPT